MEPNFETPHITPEQAPSLPPVSPERVPGAGERSGVEREPQVGEHESTPQSQIALPPVDDIAAPTLPQPVTTDADQDDATNLLASVPAVAADDDLIEKEWVDKAKRIITETADDPHRREAAVSQLQREYLRKRYGKEIGTSD